MTKEELEQLKSTVKQWLFHTGSLDPTNYANELKLKFIEPREKRIAELEEKISVLLSCKNCPENKGGFICVKEYENKCLAQKIQYIKELRAENAELNNFIMQSKKDGISPINALIIKNLGNQLTKAKEIMNIAIEGIKHWGVVGGTERPFEKQAEMLFNLFLDKAEQFLSEVEK